MYESVEPAPSRASVMAASGTPFGVAVIVAGAFGLLLLIRSGFRGSVVS